MRSWRPDQGSRYAPLHKARVHRASRQLDSGCVWGCLLHALKGGSHTYRCHAASPWHHKCLAAASICCQDQKLLYACLKLELSLHYRLISSALSKKHTVQGAWNIPKLLKWSMPCTPRWLKNHHLAAMTALLQRSILLHFAQRVNLTWNVCSCLSGSQDTQLKSWVAVCLNATRPAQRSQGNL